MKQTLLLVTLIATMALPGISRGQQAVLTFTPVGSTSILPGGDLTFDVSLTVSGGASVAGVDYSILAPASNEFTLLTFTNTGSTFNTLGPTNPNNTPLNPSSIDLGAAPASSVGNGTYFLSEITLQASPLLALGSYNLTAFNADWIDGSTFATESFGAPTASIQTLVVPEPSTWALLLLGSLAMATWARRTKSSAS